VAFETVLELTQGRHRVEGEAHHEVVEEKA
jgi:hypothetical protein